MLLLHRKRRVPQLVVGGATVDLLLRQVAHRRYDIGLRIVLKSVQEHLGGGNRFLRLVLFINQSVQVVVLLLVYKLLIYSKLLAVVDSIAALESTGADHFVDKVFSVGRQFRLPVSLHDKVAL